MGRGHTFPTSHDRLLEFKCHMAEGSRHNTLAKDAPNDKTFTTALDTMEILSLMGITRWI